MIVCLCEGVNDRAIRAAIDDGASTVRDVGRHCRAGTSCGLCRCDIKEMLRDRPRGDTGTSDAPLAK